MTQIPFKASLELVTEAMFEAHGFNLMSEAQSHPTNVMAEQYDEPMTSESKCITPMTAFLYRGTLDINQ